MTAEATPGALGSNEWLGRMVALADKRREYLFGLLDDAPWFTVAKQMEIPHE